MTFPRHNPDREVNWEAIAMLQVWDSAESAARAVEEKAAIAMLQV
jgi:hypothetical protein